MRGVIYVVLAGVAGIGCSFEASVSPPSTAVDGSTTLPMIDAGRDAYVPDTFVKVCAAAYASVPAAQTTSKYRRVQVQRTWTAAKADCESDGGHLAIPETAVEAIALHAYVDPLDSSPYIWVGILDPELDGTWVTVTGQPFSAISWGTGDPDQRAGEIYSLVFSDGKFFDWFDYGTQEYACECAP